MALEDFGAQVTGRVSGPCKWQRSLSLCQYVGKPIRVLHRKEVVGEVQGAESGGMLMEEPACCISQRHCSSLLLALHKSQRH